ncbi:MAG TPA: PilN domain-containing protein [Blastocatellia bacterium]|nr:PilN domain-containing protein [Blastocatellia bacterium]
MIKVNLLQNTVERTSVEAVETAISSQGTRQVVMVLIALGACIGACVMDYTMTVRANTKVKEEYAVEEKTAAQLQDLNKQVTELQSKNKAVEDRINAIQRLRADQVGPLRLLQVVNARLPDDKDFRLTSIKQDKESVILINGYSPSESKVTEFAQKLEFSNGLFSKFNVQTKRIANPEKGQGKVEADGSESEAVEFQIRCTYSPQTLLANGDADGKAPAAAANPTTAPAASAPNSDKPAGGAGTAQGAGK